MELKEKALTVWKIYFNIYFMRYLSSPASSAIEHLKYKTMFCFMFVFLLISTQDQNTAQL